MLEDHMTDDEIDAAVPRAGDFADWLRMARLVRTSLEANGGICRSLLRARPDVPDPQEAAA